MREVSLRRFLAGPTSPERVALLSIWFREHNNPRYAELLPRLERLDACLLRLPRARVPRGVAYRSWVAARPSGRRAAAIDIAADSTPGGG